MPMPSIGFISQDWSFVKEQQLMFPNGCTWYRCVVPAMILEKHNFTCHVGVPAITDKDKLGIQYSSPLYASSGIAEGHDIYVFKLVMHKDVLSRIDNCIESGRKIVIDIDDWFDNLPDTNKAKEVTDPNRNPINNREIYFKIIEKAHALICSTQFLFEFYSQKYPLKPIFLVRNSIDIERWQTITPAPRVPVIGWVGATPWRSNDLEELSPFMNEYLISRNLMFHHAGHIDNAAHAADLMQIDKSRITTESMRPITQLQQLMKNIDIGVVPLSNIQFNHAKSYLKGLEYAAAGIPFIASDLPEYRYLSEHGVGRIAKTSSDWILHFDELQDLSLRRDEAILNKEIVNELFSISSAAPIWIETFKNIMDIE